jgi:hypothetical protein
MDAIAITVQLPRIIFEIDLVQGRGTGNRFEPPSRMALLRFQPSRIRFDPWRLGVPPKATANSGQQELLNRVGAALLI